jgi:hypothetical protein
MGQLCNGRMVDDWIFAEAPEVRGRYVVETARHMLYSTVRYAEQKCEPVIYPADWWQAVKERFAPVWLRKRWPVQHRVWEPFVIYPEIALPREKHYIHIREISGLR